MSKHGGFTGALEKVGFFESEPSLTPAAPEPEAPHSAWTTPATMPVTASGTLTAADQAQMKSLEATIYAKQSSYVAFQRVRESLGAAADLQTVFKVLKAANPSLTLETVLSDIDGHLGIIAHNRQDFEAQIAQARATRVDGRTQQIASLTETNRRAADDITARTQQIAILQSGLNTASASISDAASRFKMVEDQLLAPLLQVKQSLSSLA